MEQIILNPEVIGPDSWRQLGQMQQSLGLAVVFLVLFASNMLIGHNMIPSFIGSHHIPESWGRTRPIFYAFAVIFFALSMFFIGRATDSASVLRDFWPVYWI